MERLGIEMAPLAAARRPLCRGCLDWSVRRLHLAGELGAALLERFHALRWAARIDGTRIVAFRKAGQASFERLFLPGPTG